jgi:hypothetical protein
LGFIVSPQERLRADHAAKQRQILDTDSATVTLGEASVITELKLANDNLRWRLQQKQSLVNAQQMMILDLQRQVADFRRGKEGKEDSTDRPDNGVVDSSTPPL